MGSFEGMTAVVTGGSAGIGLATAKRLAAEGAHVVITGRRAEQLETAVAEIGDATAVVGDVSVTGDVERLYQQVRELGRGVDVLVANAGTNQVATLEETTEESHDRLFDVNVKGTFLTVQKALPVLNEGASVVLVASTAGGSGTPGQGAYGATKAAVRSYARTWANELSGRGVRVNVVSPGPVDTPLWDEVFGARAEEVKATVAAGLPARRVADPDEVAAAVVFLASSQSSFVDGVELHVDGGMNQV
ncbi:glucose 1-dehydrogenase [Pseudokineococcus marinus]|uniref:Glucose 1-dehydrogenase n=1 Tax=Pseudokineococcus marinus TaxID=351215 RepID=A0A849BPR0_9ACTN|nr:glucose 1-dehydrogenase [Pseudokineococcus marinus]NNH22544.1 glucose 1-dehydrogenase [Pseudokineococcus marinus]